MKEHNPIQFKTEDGKSVVIREMDDSYIFAGDMRENPHTGKPGCCTAHGEVDPKTARPDPVFEEYHREAMRRYGQSAILAWYDEKVVGFVNFHPVNAAFDGLCPGRNPERIQQDFQQFEWPEKPADKLRILCVSIAPAFQRMGLGTELIEALIQWAPDWGYKRLHVGANEKSWWIPCKPFYDDLGFGVVETIEFGEPNPVGDTKVFVMERDV